MRFSGFVLGLPVGLACATIALASACTLYGPSLLGSGGATAGSGSPGSGMPTGAGGNTTSCSQPDQCPGMDTTCGTRTCTDGACGVNAMALGTVIPDEKKGDCKKNVCDGSGDATTTADPTDLPNDNNECTTDGCNADEPTFTNKSGSCTVGGKVCKDGKCVECLVPGDCPPGGTCTAQNTCAGMHCTDGIQDIDESDKDCGGSCSKCVNGKLCNSPADCLSNLCATTCQASCTDGLQDQDETGTDCGGSCGPCAVGGGCATGMDCVSGSCSNGTTCDEYKLLISESRFHGPNGGTDDFVEIYNAAAARAILATDVGVDTRTLGSTSFGNKWLGSGQTIQGHGHYLIAGGGYAGAVAADTQLASGTGLVSDKASVLLRHGATTLDVLCIFCGTGTFDATYFCEGAPYNLVGCTSNTSDRSLERKPGGAMGNGTDTNDNTADFNLISPSAPQDLASAPAP